MYSPDSSPALQQFLASIKVVLVNTTLPANIGSSARAMHTMGLSNLVVVNPKHPIDEDAIALAAGATQILQHATLCDTLQDAIKDCQWVLAASSRKRHMPQLVITPRQAGQLMLEQFSQFTVLPKSSGHTLAPAPENAFKIAILFGREDRGLTNDELQLADYHVQIPANPAYGVLNVAAAVQVIASVFFEQASEFFMPDMYQKFSDLPNSPSALSQLAGPLENIEKHFEKQIDPKTNANTENYASSQCNLATHSVATPVLENASLKNDSSTNNTLETNTLAKNTPEIHYIIRQVWDENPITHDQKHALQANILTLLEQLELYHPANPKAMPHRLARLAHRLQLDTKEYEILQAVLARLQKRLG